MSSRRIIGLLLFLITLGVYLPVMQDGFINYDDNDYVTENPVVQNGLTWPGAVGRCIFSDEGRPDAALEYSRTAVRLNPRSPSPHTSLGIILSELKHYDAAQAEFFEALRLAPDNVPAHFMMARTF